MTSMTLNFLGGAPFQLLYDGVKLALRNTRKFKTQLRSLKFTLDCLQPQIIEQIRLQNLQLNIPVQEIQELQRKMGEGIVLVDRLSSISNCNIHVWGSCCCLVDSYADQLDELNESLRRLVEILRLQSLAQVNDIGILARTTRDKQDDVGNKQLEILSNQRYIIGTLMKQHQILERIEGNVVAASTGREGGAAPVQVLRLRAVFQELFDAVVQVKVKNSWFKQFLEDFKFTLDCLKPLVQVIAECDKVVHFPKVDILEDFIVYLEKGVELVYKCSKTSLCYRFKKYKYVNSLYEIDGSLQRLFNILRLQIENDVNEALVYVSKLEKEIEEIECALQHLQNESSAAKPQLPTAELDVMTMQVTRGVKESMDSTGNVEVGDDESHMQTEGSSLAPQLIDVAEVESPSPTMASDAMSIVETSDWSRNMEVGVERTEGQGKKDIEILLALTKEAEKQRHMAATLIQVAYRRHLDRKILRNVEVGDDESHMQTEGSSLAPQRIDVAVVESPSPTMASDAMSIVETSDSSRNMEVGVERTEGQGEKDIILLALTNEAEKRRHMAARHIQVAYKRHKDRKILRIVEARTVKKKFPPNMLMNAWKKLEKSLGLVPDELDASCVPQDDGEEVTPSSTQGKQWKSSPWVKRFPPKAGNDWKKMESGTSSVPDGSVLRRLQDEYG